MATTHHVGGTLDLQGARAYHAARAGLEWGVYHVLRLGTPCSNLDNKSIVWGGSLAGLRATLTCLETVHDEGGINVRMVRLTVTACSDTSCPAGNPRPPGYVERQLRITLTPG